MTTNRCINEFVTVEVVFGAYAGFQEQNISISLFSLCPEVIQTNN